MTELLNLNRLPFFAAVVETGSFTAAGDRLGVAKAVVSHQVKKLEEELGVTLLARTTRRVQSTETGRLFYDRCAVILRDAGSAFADISSSAAIPTGTLAISAPIDYGAMAVGPAIALFMQRYPHMRVDVTFDDNVFDFSEKSLDVAIRVGWPTDSSYPAQRLGTFQQFLVGSPALARHLPLRLDPKAVEALPWVANNALKAPLRWQFSRGKSEKLIIEARSSISADKTPAAYACVLAGAAVSVFPDFRVAGDIAAGRLVHLLPDWTLPTGGIHSIYPATRFRPAKVRLFIEILKRQERARTTAADGTGGCLRESSKAVSNIQSDGTAGS
ncbi:LysR family transcriptional regulator [Mesorhizobium xinjiangense]|uniref:LysR family transcriptional regulator n=1 Tax=Mesorhizobium xinjiangense TaxID=2678685 RepID=UPI0012ED0788|nr:LysR family transcriptional regulator [Mesorhizobium xinjiangense]